jgi:hypothetical protein
MKRTKIEERLAEAEKRFPKKVKALKEKGKWSAEQEERAVKAGKKTK